jgi:inner membrane transporter RhtA
MQQMAGNRQRYGAVAMVVTATFSVEGGAAVAKSLFADLGPPGVVFLRLLFGAAALWAIGRPNLLGRSARDLRLVAVFGVVLVTMNLAFYESLSRLPLGVAVTVEFIGPLTVAIAGSRRRLDLVWVALAALGIVLLAYGGGNAGHPLGLLLGGVAGVMWALYIVLGARLGRVFAGPSGLAPAMTVGAVIALPWAIVSAGDHLRSPQLLGAGVGVGLLSSALPWSLELEALRRLPMHVFSVLLSIEPAVAALCGAAFLHEHLGLRSWAAIGLVVVASGGATARGGRAELPPDV